ncbi:hypothetical protein DRJ48_02445 [Candidatus Woesearchaeota archaeon]|nr:MAG: hypothetical protein DRJ48_02445 [Candidatus Woesearchaeota archaeon]
MVKPEKYFYLEDGGIIKNIRELALRLDEISDSVFQRHVNQDKNDFANWIEFVFKEKNLAKQLRGVMDKKQFQIVLLKHFVRRKTKNIKKFKCPHCGKGFSTKVGLSVHKTIAHTKKR